MQIPFIESHKFAEQVTWLNAEEAVWELENELLAVQDTVKLYREGRLEELRTRERKPLVLLR